jgi:ornithine cyclodeaminase/alanine dehydrogenase-like protein (mu-crystallin family)
VAGKHRIECRFLSQEDLIASGALDVRRAMATAEEAMLAYRSDRILFPEKIVQIFDQDTQERINCLPATLLTDHVCGVKWVSVFPRNPAVHGIQNLAAVIVLSEIETGHPLAFMDGTLCSNLRVGAMGGVAATYFARQDSVSIGFIGSGEQAKMHLLAMKTAVPSLRECAVSDLHEVEERIFADEMSKLFPDMTFRCTGHDNQAAVDGADIIVTATSAQQPLLKADWVKPGSFYSHIGGWEDEYAVAAQADTIVCDEWETVKHRTQTLSRMYRDGQLTDDDIAADLDQVVAGEKPGRQSPDERVYFNAVGLAYADVSIAHMMFLQAQAAGVGQMLTLQDTMLFKHENLREAIRL